MNNIPREEEKKCECGCEGNNKDFDPSKIWDKNCIYSSQYSDTSWEEEFLKSKHATRLTPADRQVVILYFRSLIQKEREEAYKVGVKVQQGHQVEFLKHFKAKVLEESRTDTITEILEVIERMEKEIVDVGFLRIKVFINPKAIEKSGIELDLLSNLKEKLSQLIKKQ